MDNGQTVLDPACLHIASAFSQVRNAASNTGAGRSLALLLASRRIDHGMLEHGVSLFQPVVPFSRALAERRGDKSGTAPTEGDGAARGARAQGPASQRTAVVRVVLPFDPGPRSGHVQELLYDRVVCRVLQPGLPEKRVEEGGAQAGVWEGRGQGCRGATAGGV